MLISPHLDDAVLSAWHAVSGESDVVVVGVFAGVPAAGTVTVVDQLNGASDSATWVLRRRADDVEALTRAGAGVRQLDFLDAQYRMLGMPSLRDQVAADPGRFVELASREPFLRFPPDEIAARLRATLDDDCLVYLPAGIGGHPDHLAVGRLGQILLDEVDEVRFFADSPYFLSDGVPSWFSGGGQSWFDDGRLHRVFHGIGMDPENLRLHAVTLTARQNSAKLAAIRCYGTEQRHLRRRLVLDEPARSLTRFEAYWTLPPRPTAA